jgi:hypothetical protein
MRLRHVLLLPLIAAFLLMAKAAYALWVEYQLTPKALAFDGRTFTIQSKARPEDGLLQFEVVVTPTADARRKHVSQFTTGYLTLTGEAGRIAHVPIEGKREGEKVRYWFRVSTESVPYSRFEISESNDTSIRGAKEERVEILMGGVSYWFRLRDFTSSK